MFSLVRKILNQARSFDALFDRVSRIEAQLERYERLADENESLWNYLDEQKECVDSLSGKELEENINNWIAQNELAINSSDEQAVADAQLSLMGNDGYKKVYVEGHRPFCFMLG